MAGSHTGLFLSAWCSPPDEDAFAEVASHDEDIDRAEFEHLTGADRPGSYLLAPAAAPHEAPAATPHEAHAAAPREASAAAPREVPGAASHEAPAAARSAQTRPGGVRNEG
ncbi:hypothetical protein [Dactylosporangium darangshiense]|uniref:Uncharacterized protein n=1 Tax=Dactylosporangium darangshiense TaxID=579108 RepID=A0ABP8D7W0_9ACTN